MIDPSIPLSFNPQAQTGPDANKLLALLANVQQYKAQEQGQQRQNALRQIFANPASLDKSGAVTPDAQRQIMGIDPGTGLKIRQQMIEGEQSKATLANTQSEAAIRRMTLMHDKNDEAIQVYDDSLAAGMSDPAARAAAQKVYSGGLAELGKGGLFSEDQLAQINPQFDPIRARANALSLKDRLARQDKQTVEAERIAHDRAMEAPGARGIPIADAILGQESGNRDDAKTSVTGAVGPGQIEPATFKAYAKPGEKIDTPADNRAVSRRIVADLESKYPGDPARVAVGYFSGPGNVAPPGSTTPWIRDKKDPTGKSTSSYVADVLGRVGGGKPPAKEYSNPIEMTDASGKQVLAQQAKNGQWVTADENHTPIKISGISGKEGISDDAANLIADQVLAGNRAAVSGLARSTQNITKVNNALARIAKERGMSGPDLAAKQAEFSGWVQGERTLGARTANMEVAANEVKNMAPLALSASKEVDRTQFPSLNSIIQAAEKGTGDENVVRFGLAANSLIYTYAKFLNPTGIPTDADKARATDILSTAWTKGQFSAAIEQIQKEIKSGQAAVKETRGEIGSAIAGKGPAADAPAAAAPPKADAGSQDAPFPAKTKADYESLKAGARYTKPGDPPGTYRVKQ